MKKTTLCFIFLIVMFGTVFAQESALDEGIRNWKTFPYSLGGGLESGLNTRENFAMGFSAVIDRYLFGPHAAMGIKATMYSDFNTVTSSEAQLNFRLYIHELWWGLFFTQFGFGAAFYTEETRNINTYLMDFALGYRIYIQKGFFRGFYVEPLMRFGYPFEWGFGLYAGHWFNF